MLFELYYLCLEMDSLIPKHIPLDAHTEIIIRIVVEETMTPEVRMICGFVASHIRINPPA